MIELSTKTTNSLPNDMIQHAATSEDLGEEEQSFYDSIKNRLNIIARTPGKDVIARILKHSKSA